MTKCNVPIGLFLGVMLCLAQSASRTADDRSTCPGGKVSVDLDLVTSPTSADDLIQMSQLIVDGTVSTVPPAVNTNPGHADEIETDSLISFGTTLYGTLPAGINSIVIAQVGGKTAECEEVIPADPLLNSGERYIFFLMKDERSQPVNTTGFPRYDVVGVWSGKAKVENGIIRFSPEANPRLRALDGTDVNAFLAMVKERVPILKPIQHP